MSERYGTDELSTIMLAVGLLLNIIGGFFFWPLTVVSYLIYAFALYRFFSRDLYARRREFGFYLQTKRSIISFFRCIKMKFQDRKTLKYFKCPNCKQQLRAPKGRGKILVTCQKCHKSFTMET